MRSIVPIIAFVATVFAAPAPTVSWTPELGAYYAAVAQHIQDASASGIAPPSCDLSKASFPVAPTPLPSPTGTLQIVVLGRGVQNYTCNLANATATPVAIGAIANLYNTSCVASNYNDLMQMLPELALQYPLPTNNDAPLQPTNLLRAGHHYFSSAGVPTFDLNDNAAAKLGVVAAKVMNKTAAPSTSSKGQAGVGYGSVPWLYLTATSASSSIIKSLYRVNTAGGQPPPTCSNSSAAFSVEYSAEYWFYS